MNHESLNKENVRKRARARKFDFHKRTPPEDELSRRRRRDYEASMLVEKHYEKDNE